MSGFLLGLVIGANVGIVVAALLFASARDEERAAEVPPLEAHR